MKISLILGVLGFLTVGSSLPAIALQTPGGLQSAAVKKRVPITLAENGKALLPIVLSAKASAQTRTVAAELSGYLKRITGAEFKIESGDGSSGIVLGTLAEFSVPDLKQALAIRENHDGVEALAIRTEAKRVLLLGATDLGASHAAFRFLETLGCRWFFPAKEWEVVPSKSVLRVALDEVNRPAVLSRRIWWSYGMYMDDTNLPKEEGLIWKDWEAWKRHNRMAWSMLLYDSHAYPNIYEQNRKAFDEHPEYLALVGGKRVSGQLCLSNPAVRRLAVEYGLNYFKKNPDADMVSMEPADGGSMCECPECAKLGSISERVFGIANEVARAVGKAYPGKGVGLLAYFEHSDPPSFKLEPNVYIQLTTLYTDGKLNFEQQLKLWPEHTQNFGIYDYLSTWVWDQDRIRPATSAGYAASLKYVRTKIPQFVALGAKSYDAESSNAWGQYGIGYYVTNKLLWNPRADVDSLVKDFYDKAFGPAAPVMKRFYDRISPDNKPIFGKDLLGRAYRDIQEASVLAKDRPDVEARLDGLKQYLRFNYLCWQLDVNPADKVVRKQLYLQLITQAYRTRRCYMMHATPMITMWSDYAAKEFGEPTWSYWFESKDKPWKVETPYTHEETEREFQEGLQYFQPQDVSEVKFSDDLVPVQMPATKFAHYDSYMTSRSTTQFFQAGARFALCSFKGEPLEIELCMVPKPVGQYSLEDAAGKILVSGPAQPVSERKLNDNHAQTFLFKVPKAGIYYFEVHSPSWFVAFGDKQPATGILPRERSLDSYCWGGQVSFYVPKGTRQIQYYWSGMPHKISNPDGVFSQEITANNEYVSIPVPEGMDGRAWGVGPRLGQMWLVNCPNFFAADPNALMVPREVAIKDGLTIRK